MLMKKLDRYVNLLNKIEKKEEVPFEDIFEEFSYASSEKKVKMLLEMSDNNRKKLQALMDGGLI